MHVYRSTNINPIHIFQLQKSNTIYLVYIYYNFFNRCIFLQFNNLNLVTNLKIYCFYVILIACKCTPLYKKIRLWCKKWVILPCNHLVNQACMNTSTLIHFLMDLSIALSTIVKVLATLFNLLSSFSFRLHSLISFATTLAITLDHIMFKYSSKMTTWNML